MSDEKDGAARRSRRKLSSRRTHAPTEFDFIDGLRLRAQRQLVKHSTHSSLITHHSSLIKGIGDDAAIIRHRRSGFDTVVTADLLVEGIDFRVMTTAPRLLGHKALAVSLSDVAAMGARPRWALLSIGAPERVWNGKFLDQFYEGFFELADAHGVALAGGDVSRTGSVEGTSADAPLVIDSVVIGEVKSGRAVLRSGARPGDRIFVTGTLGGAAAGLSLLERGVRLRRAVTAKGPDAKPEGASPGEARRRLMLRQLRPEPRTAWGQMLGRGRLATAMIDLSDGLSSDLAHVCRESGVGARIRASSIPVDLSIRRATDFTNSDALELALGGGEDFELLFTTSRRNVAKIPERLDGVPATEIGEVTDASGGILLVEGGRARKLRASGFRHF